MTDDLVKRLRETAGQYDEHMWHTDIELEAAARIEELERHVEEWKQRCLSVFVTMISLVGDTKEERANIRAIFEGPEELLAGGKNDR
jgi:formyltetrahydrofolate synthetase